VALRPTSRFRTAPLSLCRSSPAARGDDAGADAPTEAEDDRSRRQSADPRSRSSKTRRLERNRRQPPRNHRGRRAEHRSRKRLKKLAPLPGLISNSVPHTPPGTSQCFREVYESQQHDPVRLRPQSLSRVRFLRWPAWPVVPELVLAPPPRAVWLAVARDVAPRRSSHRASRAGPGNSDVGVWAARSFRPAAQPGQRTAHAVGRLRTAVIRR
jgi:hypothetical protein